MEWADQSQVINKSTNTNRCPAISYSLAGVAQLLKNVFLKFPHLRDLPAHTETPGMCSLLCECSPLQRQTLVLSSHHAFFRIWLTDCSSLNLAFFLSLADILTTFSPLQTQVVVVSRYECSLQTFTWLVTIASVLAIWAFSSQVLFLGDTVWCVFDILTWSLWLNIAEPYLLVPNILACWSSQQSRWVMSQNGSYKHTSSSRMSKKYTKPLEPWWTRLRVHQFTVLFPESGQPDSSMKHIVLLLPEMSPQYTKKG